MRTLEEATAAFKPVTNLGDDQRGALTIIESQFLNLVEHVFSEVPATADRAAAVRKLLEAKWTCVQAITHDWNTGSVKAAS